nr:MAG TPA: hypothetical protein [Bacteriophage sp.]
MLIYGLHFALPPFAIQYNIWILDSQEKFINPVSKIA